MDIRDLDFVWCTGRVHRTINKFHDRKVKYHMEIEDAASTKKHLEERIHEVTKL